MKLDLFTSLSTLALALADYNVTLVTESSDSDVSGKSLSAFHSGAGFNFLYLAGSGSVFSYSEDADSVYEPLPVDYQNGLQIVKYNLTVFPNTNELSFSVVGGAPVGVADSYLSLNGSSTFYAAKDTSYDPYGYSKYSYQLVSTSSDGALPVKVKIVSNSTSSTNSSAASSSIAVASSTGTSAPAIANSGVVTKLCSAAAAVAGAALLL